MKRMCREEEITTILHHWNHTYDGVYKEGFGKTYLHSLFVILIWFVLSFTGIKWAFPLFKTEFSVYIYMILVYIPSPFLASRIYQSWKKKRCYLQIKKSKKLQVNGGIIVKIDKASHIIFFLEDDTRDQKRKHYLLSCHATRKDIDKCKPGDRVAILYGINGQDDKTNLMQMTRGLSKIFPKPCEQKKRTLNELSKFPAYPNVFCLGLSQEQRRITESELNQIKDSIRDHREIWKNKILIGGIIGLLFLFLNGFVFFLRYAEANNASVFLLCIGNCLMMVFAFYIVKGRRRFVKEILSINEASVTEAVYGYSDLCGGGPHFYVYENHKGKIEEISYPGGIAFVKYGERLLELQLGNRLLFYKINDKKAYNCASVKWKKESK